MKIKHSPGRSRIEKGTQWAQIEGQHDVVLIMVGDTYNEREVSPGLVESDFHVVTISTADWREVVRHVEENLDP